jgi:hypothetical protein
MCRRGVGRVVSARAPDVHDWVHVCVHMSVRSSACVFVRTYARMRRMHPSLNRGRRRVRARVRVRAERRATATFQLGITVSMYII